MGRYREYGSNAARQRAYRQRKAEQEKRLREAARVAKHTDALRKRLVRVLGLLGSDYPGERDNAARLAARMVAEAGLTWYELLNVTEDKS